jgi:hypothetical protein
VERKNAPAFERRQFPQLDPPKPMVPKSAQQRILSKTCPKRLRIKRANAPSQPCVPSTATTTTTPRARVPRDKQWADNDNPPPKRKQDSGHRVSVISQKGEWTRNALFIICEEWLDGVHMWRQSAVQRIESVKGVFGAACL